MKVRITKPIRRALEEGHRNLYWEVGHWEFRLRAVTGHHENGRLITRKLWETCEGPRADQMAELVDAEYGTDCKRALDRAVFERSAWCMYNTV